METSGRAAVRERERGVLGSLTRQARFAGVFQPGKCYSQPRPPGLGVHSRLGPHCLSLARPALGTQTPSGALAAQASALPVPGMQPVLSVLLRETGREGGRERLQLVMDQSGSPARWPEKTPHAWLGPALAVTPAVGGSWGLSLAQVWDCWDAQGRLPFKMHTGPRRGAGQGGAAACPAELQGGAPAGTWPTGSWPHSIFS